ncbi:hypothetical protein FYK55_21655 [Roseiconus nitratireducens]|uniref:Uncharacterized protein n=1 Tax=Roseiconus nitratireducens TaxID=2605748 RepID=A0A5M6CYD2_9BACT|nr:hypothetical protein [Roseiconus nitratireducens]KAA5540238.1 hypothetical protein FYK55_21655 [Roseiconus nitratireducens]
MIAFLKSLREKWNNWCGDHEMELEIRKHLTRNGYYGGTVKLQNVRLVAVQRPGWLQIYRFEAVARLKVEESDGPDPEPQYDQLYGLVRDDIRHKLTRVRVFHDPAERRELFLRWSEDLIQLRGSHGLV